MHVTELQHCQNRSQTVTKKEASSSNWYLVFHLHPEEGVRLRELPLHFPLSKILLQTGITKSFRPSKAKFSNSYWLKPTFIIRNFAL